MSLIQNRAKLKVLKKKLRSQLFLRSLRIQYNNNPLQMLNLLKTTHYTTSMHMEGLNQLDSFWITIESNLQIKNSKGMSGKKTKKTCQEKKFQPSNLVMALKLVKVPQFWDSLERNTDIIQKIHLRLINVIIWLTATMINLLESLWTPPSLIKF